MFQPRFFPNLELISVQNGQVCMCTDTTFVMRPVAQEFLSILHHILQTFDKKQHHVISSKGRATLDRLVDDAKSKGAKVTQAPGASDEGNLYPATVIEDMTHDMDWHTLESFGPLLGVRVVDSEEEIIKLFHESGYGLSSSIFTKNHLRALYLSRKLDVGAVHVNSNSVHDEGNFPHGGVGSSGYGRFGGAWALREFTRTKTVMLYPD